MGIDELKNRLRQVSGMAADLDKQAFEPMPPGPPPNSPDAMMAGGGGMPPMDPSMMAAGGMPPQDPAMAAGGMPPQDPAMAAGGMPPQDPAMAAGGMPPQGMPPMDPSMMAAGGMPPQGMPPMDPSMMAAGGAPMDPSMAGGTPVQLNLEDLQAVVEQALEASKAKDDDARLTNKELGDKVDKLTATLNAVATAMGVDVSNVPLPSPADKMSDQAPETSQMNPEDAALMSPEEGEPPAPEQVPPTPTAAPVPPPPQAPMQLTAEEYRKQPPAEGNMVAHMLLNLKMNR